MAFVLFMLFLLSPLITLTAAFLAAEKAKHPRRTTYAPQYVEYGSNSPMEGHQYAVHYFI